MKKIEGGKLRKEVKGGELRNEKKGKKGLKKDLDGIGMKGEGREDEDGEFRKIKKKGVVIVRRKEDMIMKILDSMRGEEIIEVEGWGKENEEKGREEEGKESGIGKLEDEDWKVVEIKENIKNLVDKLNIESEIGIGENERKKIGRDMNKKESGGRWNIKSKERIRGEEGEEGLRIINIGENGKKKIMIEMKGICKRDMESSEMEKEC